MIVANVPFASPGVILYLGQSATFSPLLQLALCTNEMAVFTRKKKDFFFIRRLKIKNNINL